MARDIEKLSAAFEKDAVYFQAMSLVGYAQMVIHKTELLEYLHDVGLLPEVPA